MHSKSIVKDFPRLHFPRGIVLVRSANRIWRSCCGRRRHAHQAMYRAALSFPLHQSFVMAFRWHVKPRTVLSPLPVHVSARSVALCSKKLVTIIMRLRMSHIPAKSMHAVFVLTLKSNQNRVGLVAVRAAHNFPQPIYPTLNEMTSCLTVGAGLNLICFSIRLGQDEEVFCLEEVILWHSLCNPFRISPNSVISNWFQWQHES